MTVPTLRTINSTDFCLKLIPFHGVAARISLRTPEGLPGRGLPEPLLGLGESRASKLRSMAEARGLPGSTSASACCAANWREVSWYRDRFLHRYAVQTDS